MTRTNIAAVPYHIGFLGVAAGATGASAEVYQRRLGAEGSIEGVQINFQPGAQSDLRVTPTVRGTPLVRSDPTEESEDYPAEVFGSGETVDLPASMPIDADETIGARVENYASDPLNGHIIFYVDHRRGRTTRAEMDEEYRDEELTILERILWALDPDERAAARTGGD